MVPSAGRVTDPGTGWLHTNQVLMEPGLPVSAPCSWPRWGLAFRARRTPAASADCLGVSLVSVESHAPAERITDPLPGWGGASLLRAYGCLLKDIWIPIAKTRGVERTSAERKGDPKEKLNSPTLGRAETGVAGGWGAGGLVGTTRAMASERPRRVTGLPLSHCFKFRFTFLGESLFGRVWPRIDSLAS